ncbi:hypothetical protein IAD21_05427 [Abditibacteriota bacterium]|nr:hypothetical protein IAD21_05427 [Abditibacteriota bacterium]
MKIHQLASITGAAFAISTPLAVQAAPVLPTNAVDSIIFGDTSSEKAHHFEGQNTNAVIGSLGESARVSLPKTPLDYYGGDLTFDMKVDPAKQNYLTVKFWGSDLNGGQKALLYINGEQLGYRHLGDYEALNHGATEPSFRNRFFYYTSILPLPLTRGRRNLTLTLRTIGSINGYSIFGGYDGYQTKMAAPSRGYYRAYTHTDAALAGLERETQGTAPLPQVRPPVDDAQVIANYKTRLGGSIRNLMTSAKGSLSINDIAFLSSALPQAWTSAGVDEEGKKQTMAQLVASIDKQSQNVLIPDFAAKGRYQGDWGGSFAPIGDAIYWMDKELSPAQWQTLLDEKIAFGNDTVTRREAWTRMMKVNFDYARTHIAYISNQADICLYGAYRSNKALQIINPAIAEPEDTAKRFLFEAAGIAPFLGNDILDANGKLVGRERPLGDHYLQVTLKGLTREWTYVAIYGEWTNDIGLWWEMYGHDELLKKALINAEARAHMREPDFDDEGFRAMRMEGVIESRGTAYPDNLGYGTRWNGGRGMQVARLKRLMDASGKYNGPEWAPYRKIAAESVAYAQQMLRDNQYLNSINEAGDVELPDDYAYVKNHPTVGAVLPMTYLMWYQPDELAKLRAAGLNEAAYQRFAWTDEDDGVVALRDGDLTMYVGLIMRTGSGVNGLARVHCTTPQFDRMAALIPDVQFETTGEFSVRPDWTNAGFIGLLPPPEGPRQALEGEILPVATQPLVDVKPNKRHDSPYAGYANFYSLRYLNYLIGMNTTRAAYGNARSYELRLPKDFKGSSAFDFVSGKNVPVKNGAVQVGPLSTVVLRLPTQNDPQPWPNATRLVAAARNENGVSVRWQHAPNAERYIVKRATSMNGPFVQVGQTNGENLFVDKNAPANGDLFYTVSGVNQNGVGLDSPSAKVGPIAPEIVAWLDQKPVDLTDAPGIPRDLAGENIKRRVVLNWKMARAGWTYNVLKSTDGVAFAPVATGLTLTNWSENDLPFDQKVSYEIVAVNRNGIAGPRTAPIRFQPIDDTTPAPWKGTDIGDVGATGDDGFLNGTFTIHASGEDIWGSQDAFRFVYQPSLGDVTIVTRVASQENSNEWAKGGLMLRESLAPNAKNVFVFRSPGHGLVMQWRGDTGGGTNSNNINGEFGATPWLKLTRRGNVFTGSVSKDGQNWTPIGTATVAIPGTAYVGLAVGSHTRGGINRTTLDNTSVSAE